MADVAACPCGRLDAAGRGLPYADCCGRYVDDFDGTPAPDAEALMRSRYTAFVRERADYLLATWQTSKRPSRVSFDAGAKWLGLEVRKHRVIDDGHAEVEFVARLREPSGRAVRLHERSRFVREDGRWYYVDGDHQ
ncbi:MAG: YchJ family metal-binding protein [Pseudomonadota bacterium]|uniref:YchJ family protein n=1 Tax=Curvibacter delicatus TaxID=80879 RepID=UPI0008376A25|nr:YchJ family metal-binding protein [Curvibacter delicatus]MEA3394801.1 YchJ family metal-binding protein [Pseudomonadota bacterium]